MCRTRMETVDELVVDVTNWRNHPVVQEQLFVFARNFAAEADRLEAEVKRLRVALRNRALAVRAARSIDLHRPRYTGMSPSDGVEATADAIQAVYQAAEAEGGG